ncbi:hypothetical protein KGF54_004309 [Candida jiufengensis]|uniref:uncharacterized protein n=1 Tax=Candida jiufengensis TaxID=497108 RepID=UPI0022246087|nr:uncharacterized protein KGF54_004309 [Candida jiufengensis]KAI5951235.1 hypothetical protein KGF54_004309 [Candida jiufengensis]
MEAVSSKVDSHIHSVLSHRNALRHIDPDKHLKDEDLLKQIGYKQELRRHYTIFETFGISFSIMSLLPSIASILPILLSSGLLGAWLSWFVASFFIFLVGCGLSFLGSAIPTSGGLYYYTNYFCPESIRVPLSFLIGCANTLGLSAGTCAINYGFAVEVLSAVFIQRDGDFEITDAKLYGLFAACVVSNIVIASLATKQAARLQAISVYLNLFLIALFVIAVPIGYSKNNKFNSKELIFSDLTNFREWPIGWSVCLSLQGAVWVIGAFDSVIHCSEECKNPQQAVAWGILGSIGACGVFGVAIVSVCVACIKDGNVQRVLESSTGSAMAQIIYDALGKQWSVAFMALIALGQYFMSTSIVIAVSRQAWSFARDDGLPIIYNWVKYVDPRIKVPVRATIFVGGLCLSLGLLVFIGPAGANALFSLTICSNNLAWMMPTLMILLPYGRKKFVPGPFWFGKPLSYTIMTAGVSWMIFVMGLSLFPDNIKVDKETMNYTVVINVGMWILSLTYYFLHGHKKYSGPKSNLEDEDEFAEGSSVIMVEEVYAETKV